MKKQEDKIKLQNRSKRKVGRRKIMNKEKGITLIALVVTIVVLLILAGVSINLVLGDNGIINKAKDAKEEQRGGSVEDYRDLWRADHFIGNMTETQTAQSLEELLTDLQGRGLLSSEEVNTIKQEGVITIGSHVIYFNLGQTEVDWSKLEPGLYEKGTANIIKSWEQLKADGEITVEDGTLTDISVTSIGDLIISSEVANFKESVTSCGATATYGNAVEYVTGLYIPQSIKQVKSLEELKKLERVVINGATTIYQCSFFGCNSLSSIVITNSVTSIGSHVLSSFNGEERSMTIYYTGTEAEWQAISGVEFFQSEYINININIVYNYNV